MSDVVQLELTSGKLQVGDMVMFVPRNPKWNRKYYSVGKISRVENSIVNIVDVSNVIHAEYDIHVVKV